MYLTDAYITSVVLAAIDEPSPELASRLWGLVADMLGDAAQPGTTMDDMYDIYGLWPLYSIL